MQKITTFLWFNDQAEEAAKFYVSIFKKSKIKMILRYGDEGAGPKGQVMTVDFQLEGQDFVALNGGPQFPFTPAISLVVKCKTQKEVDGYWDKLLKGGKKSMCGWLADKYGLSWQITPIDLLKYIGDKDKTKAARAMRAMMQMDKLEIKKIKAAYKGA